MRLSPHYSGVRNQVSNDSPRDARGDGRIRAALAALRHVAALDPDGARLENGVGFGVSDVARGHALAKLSPLTVLRSPVLSGEVLAMASRYRRQVPGGLAFGAGLTDQGSLL